MVTIRSPHVAGQFYPADKKSLLSCLDQLFSVTMAGHAKEPARGILVPHAGYIYSGETAAKTYARVELTPTVLVLGPNHTGVGCPFSVMPDGSWDTPLGRVAIDRPLSRQILEEPLFEPDESAHREEHAIEVQVPLLQYLYSGIQFVPVTVGTQDPVLLKKAGLSIGKVLESWAGRILIIASGDMNHYENERVTLEKDGRAIEALLELDEGKLAQRVSRYGISMCGFAPAYTMLVAIKHLGARRAVLVEHTTSARESGDSSRVVGYAGMIFL